MENYIEPYIWTAKVFRDDRGSFSPSFFPSEFNEFKVVQENTVKTNNPYIFRGLHWQEPPYDQAKLLRCVFGNIIDFVVDIRTGSHNYGKTYYFRLSSPENWLYVPKGFAHGYITLPNKYNLPTIVEYKIDNSYNKESERGIFLTKECFEIINKELPIGVTVEMNDRDLKWPTIDNIVSNFD